MKHSLKVTFVMILLFLSAQLVGLYTVKTYLEIDLDSSGNMTISHPDTILGPQPNLSQEEKTLTFITIILAVLIGTALLFVLIKFRMSWLWKLWFILAVTIPLAISFNVYINPIFALLFAALFAILKCFKPNVIMHNFIELFLYAGITILILPWLNLISVFLLLVFISIYDVFAVWKSKHMVKLAKFQMDSKMFAGLSIPYTKQSTKVSNKEVCVKKIVKKKESDKQTAILGGGDVAFPMLFSAAVMENLISVKQIMPLSAFLYVTVISIFVTIFLAGLFFLSKKGKFYPAMPVLSFGCFLGYFFISFFV